MSLQQEPQSPQQPVPRSPLLLDRRLSRLLVIDVQKKLVDVIPVAKQLVMNCVRLVQAAGLCNVPVFATEQYPKGLGPTVKPLAQLLPERPEKLRFSCVECLGWRPAGESECRDVVLAGIETHVCVLQTALDLLSLGYNVFVPADAVASRHKLDWEWALRRLETNGVTVTTTEAVLFEWCETAAFERFKELSLLVKEN